MESLLRWDTQLLLLFNGCHNTFLDTFFWNVSTRWLWIPLYAVLVACIIRRYGRRSLWVLLAVVAAVGLADYVSSGLIKHWVCRPRPTHAAELEGLLHILNGYRGGRYGFVSSHAANCMALALSVSLLWRDWRMTLPLMAYAFLNCWSRMYLGVHYPGDILGGLLVGSLMALVAWWLLRRFGCIKNDGTEVPSWWLAMVNAVFALTLVAACLL